MLYKKDNPHGGDIYATPVNLDFSANINPCGTPAGVVRALQEALAEVSHYPDPYCRELIHAISAYEGVPEGCILCGNGAAELIYSFCAAVKPARTVIPVPAFKEYALALQNAGGSVIQYPLNAEDDFSMTEDFLSFLQAERPDAVFLCNPNNPTGRIISSELLGEIADYAEAADAYMFLDECFIDLSDGVLSLKNLLPTHQKLCILKAFTKSYGMAGVRLGYMMSANPSLLKRMSETVQPWNVSLLAQRAGAAALKEDAYLEEARRIISVERKWLRCELEGLSFRVCSSQANFLLFRAFAGLDKALQAKGILIRNCSNYAGLSDGWFRIAVRCHAENEQLISAIRACI